MTPASVRSIHFIPGTACDHRLWSRVVPLLRDYKISFGSYDEANSLTGMINCVANGATSGGHLVGFSLGGYLAAEAIFAGKVKAQSLTLIGTSLPGLSDAEKSLRRANASTVANPSYKGMSGRRLAQFVNPENLGNRSITDTITNMERDTSRNSLKNQLLATIGRRDLRGLLQQLDIPIHLIGANGDTICDIAPMRELATYSNIQFSDIGAPVAITGHMMPLEAPQSLSDAMKSFFN